MKIKDILKNHKKRTILAVSVLGVTALTIGGVIAYSQSRDVFNGKFKLFGYKTLFTETFDAPTNWMTCDTVDKTITVTNKYDEPVSVRLKLEEQWLASDGTTELPLVSATSGLTMAQINFTQNSGWTKRGQYYYYDTDLAKDTTTTSPISGVTLNCDANLDTLDATADGVYSDATYHLKITAYTAESEASRTNKLYDAVASQANDLGSYNIDFTKKAIASNNIITANGNGVNKYTEKGQDIYYFRGQVDNNNVIWADKCWKIVRTTYTGGMKMIYNGTPSDVVVDGETVKQCLATGADSQITVNVNGANKNTFTFNDNYTSPADVGYMYGTRLTYKALSAGSTSFTFSNDVSRNGNTYTLDTSTGQSISGTWTDERTNAAVRYHYFCTDGTTSCDSTKIGYIHNFGQSSYIYYLNIAGYDDIEAAKTAMFTNTTDSNAKAMVETWFEQQNLDGHIADTRNYEDDLEDAIFCNDRTYAYGSLKGKDSDATPSDNTQASYHGAYGRNAVNNANNNLDPSLDCANQNDSFTKSDTTNGNAKLSHKIGLATADELTLAGNGWYGYDTTAYLYTGQIAFSASPDFFNYFCALEFTWNSYLYLNYGDALGLRPLVSLKSGTEFASGTGLKTDPYVVE